jgi:hypothetical protein
MKEAEKKEIPVVQEPKNISFEIPVNFQIADTLEELNEKILVELQKAKDQGKTMIIAGYTVYFAIT